MVWSQKYQNENSLKGFNKNLAVAVSEKSLRNLAWWYDARDSHV